jgi:hypothetical protein
MGLGSEIRKKPIPDPGSRGQKGTGSRIRIRNTGRETEHNRLIDGWAAAIGGSRYLSQKMDSFQLGASVISEKWK